MRGPTSWKALCLKSQLLNKPRRSSFTAAAGDEPCQPAGAFARKAYVRWKMYSVILAFTVAAVLV
jgi:hypothetical protein